MPYLSMLSTLVMFFFTVAVFNRYREKGGAHLLLWGVGLLFFGLAVLSQTALVFLYHPLLVKLWFFTGAMMSAAWLGQGTIHLLLRKRGVAATLTALLLAASVVGLVLVLRQPVNPEIAFNPAVAVTEQYKDLLNTESASFGFARGLMIFLNIYGTLALVGGAIYSAYIFWRKRVLENRILGNILIAAGGLLIAMAGSMIRARYGDWHYLAEFLSAALMYAGFVLATSKQESRQRKQEPASAHRPVG